MSKTILFHCGSAKAGSTTIQNELWAARDGLLGAGYYYCPRFVRSGNIDPLNIAVRDIRLGNREQAVREGRARLEELFEAYHTVILSNESAFGDPFHDRHDGFFPLLDKSLEGLSEMFSGYGVNTFFIIRNQADLLPSFYTQRVRQGASYKPEAYYERLMGFDLSWHPVLDKLSTAFPNLRVLPLEELTNAGLSLSEALFMDALPGGLVKIVDAKNRASSAHAIAFMRACNSFADHVAGGKTLKDRLRHTVYKQVERLVGGQGVTVPNEIRATLEAQYKATVSELTGG